MTHNVLFSLKLFIRSILGQIIALVLNSEWLKAILSSFTWRKFYSGMSILLPLLSTKGSLRNNDGDRKEDVNPK